MIISLSKLDINFNAYADVHAHTYSIDDGERQRIVASRVGHHVSLSKAKGHNTIYRTVLNLHNMAAILCQDINIATVCHMYEAKATWDCLKSG